jgi:hypothetical protein
LEDAASDNHGRRRGAAHLLTLFFRPWKAWQKKNREGTVNFLISPPVRLTQWSVNTDMQTELDRNPHVSPIMGWMRIREIIGEIGCPQS